MGFDLSHLQQPKVSPRLIQANHILGLSSVDLQQAIQQETYENPALEVAEQATCPTCGIVLMDGICQRCPSPGLASTAATPVDQFEPSQDDLPWEGNGVGSRDEEFDLLTIVAAQEPLNQRLLVELEMLLTERRQVTVAEFLVGNLDDNGWLRCTVPEAASTLGVSRADVEHVLQQLQSLEPVGIGARDLQECLLIQVIYLASQGISHPHVATIIKEHFLDMAEHRYQRMAQALGVPVDEVIAACHFVRQQLNPFPAQQESIAPRTAATQTPRFMRPDIIISAGDDGELTIEVVESKRLLLNINPQYQRIWHEVECGVSPLADHEREHVHRYLTRARVFMANLEQRRQTMQKITSLVVDYQGEFLRRGIRYLKPLTRAMVASGTGMHESTVSRATAEKYVMLPNRKVIPFSDFFKASLNVKDVIRDMIDQEGVPLTDDDIVHRLQEHGHFIARRTVAKYRSQLGILPSSLRD